MNGRTSRGHSLVELLIAMALAALVGTIVLPAVFTLQGRGLAEVSRSELQARAGRLLRFLSEELRATAFLTGASPRRSIGTPPVLVHDSAPGDPAIALSHALLAEDGGAAGDDILSVVKADSFSPPLRLTQAAPAGVTALRLDRRPNQPPGSTREIRPAPEAISHVLLANQRSCYPVGSAAQTLELIDPLGEVASPGTELLGLRVERFYRDPLGRLRRDDYTSDEILDDAVDGLQFEYLLADGRIVDLPAEPASVRGVRLTLLVRDLRADREHRDGSIYHLGNRAYGPYHDSFRRLVVSAMVEVKNLALP